MTGSAMLTAATKAPCASNPELGDPAEAAVHRCEQDAAVDVDGQVVRVELLAELPSPEDFDRAGGDVDPDKPRGVGERMAFCIAPSTVDSSREMRSST